jgi:putative glutamine amidotransferase
VARPIIGLTCYLEPASWGAWSTPAALIQQWYLDLFAEAGADLVLLPPGTRPEVVDRLDGLALAGGADVDPRRYGHEPASTTDTPRTSRDASELGLYARARELGLPVLGICRGLQVMAVAHGGTLQQHLPEVSALAHRERPGEFVRHSATFAEGSRIAALLGTTTAQVNSSHHQAVDDPGTLTVTGWAEDGTVEVCEDPSTGFVLGVQWHPEHPEDREAQLPIVRAFVEAASRTHSGVT